MNEQDEANPNYKSQAILLDKDGQLLANVQAKLSPNPRFADFRILFEADVDRVLANATILKTSDGKRFHLSNVRPCQCKYHANPHMPHVEADYDPLD